MSSFSQIYFPVPGKKGRIMERRLLTNFHIGIVDGIMNEVINTPKEHNDVFSQIAKAIRRHSTTKKKKRDWNTLVRSNTVKSDPIGTSGEAQMKQSRRQSLRQHIITNIRSSTVDQGKLLGIFQSYPKVLGMK